MIISFFGHSKICDCSELASKIEDLILQHVLECEKNVFYCGGYGDFDSMCARICHSIKEKGIMCEVFFIMPYFPNRNRVEMSLRMNSAVYDGSIYPPLERVPPKLAIVKRNEWMVDNSDLVIA